METSRRYAISFRRNGGVQSGQIYSLRDGTGQMHTTLSGIAQTLTTFLRNMYDSTEVNDASVEKLMELVRCVQHTSYEVMLESPFEPTRYTEPYKWAGGKRHPGTID